MLWVLNKYFQMTFLCYSNTAVHTFWFWLLKQLSPWLTLFSMHQRLPTFKHSSDITHYHFENNNNKSVYHCMVWFTRQRSLNCYPTFKHSSDITHYHFENNNKSVYHAIIWFTPQRSLNCYPTRVCFSNNNNNNNNILYSSLQEIKAVVRSHNEEHISIILSH